MVTGCFTDAYDQYLAEVESGTRWAGLPEIVALCQQQRSGFTIYQFHEAHLPRSLDDGQPLRRAATGKMHA